MRLLQSHLSFEEVQTIYVSNPLLLGPLEQIQSLLAMVQRLCVDREVAHAVVIFMPTLGLWSPDLPLLAVDLAVSDLADAIECKAPDAALAAEVPMNILAIARVVAQLRGVGWAQELEVVGRVHGPDVEEGHLVAGRTVALADTHRGVGGRWIGVDERRWKCEMQDIFDVSAVAGPAIGTAAGGCLGGWWYFSHGARL